MTCPSCGLVLEQAVTGICPRCGQFLSRTPGNSEAYGPAPSSRYSQYAPAGPPSRSLAGEFPPAPRPPVLPQRKSRTGIIVGVVVTLIVVACFGVGLALIAQHGNLVRTPGNQGTATAVAAAHERVFFQDPLTSNTNDWPVDSYCFFQNSAYHIRDGYLCYAPIGSLTDQSVSVDVQQVSGPNGWFYGLALRRTSKGNSYVFDIDSNGDWLFGKDVNGTYSNILRPRPNPAIKTGLNAINTLLVRAKGPHFDFSINGTNVGEEDDSTFATGICGVHGDPHLEAAFSNFVVSIPQS